MVEKAQHRSLLRKEPALPVLLIDTYPADLIGLTSVPADARLPILTFAMKEKSPVPEYLTGAPLPAVAALAYRLQDVPRKVSGEPYFKHILRAVMHVADWRVTEGMAPADIRVLMGATYLHDAIELKRQQRLPYTEDDLMADLLKIRVEPGEAERMVSLVSVMTPPREGKSFPDDNDYVKYKVRHFREKFNLEHQDARLLRIIKAADMLANMEETAEDIERGLDDSRMGRSYALRTWIFRACTLVVAKDDPENPLLPLLKTKLEKLTRAERSSVDEAQAWLPQELAMI